MNGTCVPVIYITKLLLYAQTTYVLGCFARYIPLFLNSDVSLALTLHVSTSYSHFLIREHIINKQFDDLVIDNHFFHLISRPVLCMFFLYLKNCAKHQASMQNVCLHNRRL